MILAFVSTLIFAVTTIVGVRFFVPSSCKRRPGKNSSLLNLSICLSATALYAVFIAFYVSK